MTSWRAMMQLKVNLLSLMVMSATTLERTLTGLTPPRLLTGVPWLRVGTDPLGAGHRIDLGDPNGVALTLNPLEPEPGFPAATHASLLADVFCVAGRLPPPARDVLTLALLRAYRDAPAPSFGDIDVDGALAELRCDEVTGALVRGFVRVRLGEMSRNGLFLAGGHRLDLGALLASDVEVITGVLDHTGRALVAGTLLLRLTEHARVSPDVHHVLAIDEGESLFGGALDTLVTDACSHGESVLLSGWKPAGGDRPPAGDLVAALRTPACGRTCRSAGPCTRREIGAAGRVAEAGGPLRDWAESLVTAFLTGGPLPVPAEPARHAWASLRPRTRECALASFLTDAITTRASAFRHLYPPGRLAAVAGRVATALLDGEPAPSRAGQCWVPPAFRWVHEATRVGWGRDDAVDADEIAPPLDFAIEGLADWPGIRAGQRLALLLRHPLASDAG
jgi:hypothetical protein